MPIPPCRILVLEGDPSFLDALNLAVTTPPSWGSVSIQSLRSREEFLSILRSGNPDLFVLGQAGFKEALSLLEESGVNPSALPPVLLLDPSPTPENEERAFRTGALSYHPVSSGSFNNVAFRRMIRTLLELSRLRRGESYYRNLMDQAADPIILVGRDYRILDVNRAGCAQQGSAREEILGSNIAGFLDPGELRDHPFQMQALARGETVIEERRVLRKNKTFFPAEICARALPDGSFTAIIRDITSRKSEEDLLREKEKFYLTLLENSRDAAIVVGKGGLVTYEAPSTRLVLGRKPGENVGRNAFVNMHPEDRDRVMGAFREVSQRPGAVLTLEMRMKHSDGSWRWIEGNARNLLDDPLVQGIVINYRDVTERHEAEEALRRSERHFRALIESSFDVVGILDEKGVVVYQSPSTSRVMGFDTSEVVGRSGFERLHPDDRSRVQEIMTDLVQKPGQSLVTSMRTRHADGSWRDTEVVARNLFQDPDVRGIVYNFRDVTERKRVEEALRRSERHFRALIDNAFDVYGLADADGNVLYDSQSLMRIMGRSPSATVGRDGFDVIHPDDRPQLREAFRKSLEKPERAETLFIRIRHADGTWRHVEAMIKNLLHDPDVKAIVYNYRDITERLQAEEALQNSEKYFRALIEKALDIIVVFDAEGRILYESPSIERALGYEPAERTGKNVFELLHPDDLPKAQDLFAELQANPDKPVKSRLRLRHRTGSWRTIEGIGTNLLDNPAVRGLVLNYHDITETLIAQEELLKYERLATLGGITAGLAHEIRNPLATILTTAQYLKSKVPDAQTGADLDRIIAQGDRIKNLVTETLDFSRKPVLHLEDTALPDLVQHALGLTRTQFGPDHQKVTVHQAIPPDLPTVQVDRRQMEQVVVNVLMNAFQSLSPKGGAISVEYGIMGSEIHITVRDDGPGIRSEDLAKVFEPFFTTKKHGAGLGLAICQRLVREHGGRITAERGSPGGAVFTIHLPLAKGSVSP